MTSSREESTNWLSNAGLSALISYTHHQQKQTQQVVYIYASIFVNIYLHTHIHKKNNKKKEATKLRVGQYGINKKSPATHTENIP